MKRRADATRNLTAILDAAVRVLGARPDASVEAIAAAAGVSRQTVYAHYPTRQELLAAVIERVTGQVMAEVDNIDLDQGSASDALFRLIEVSWKMFERYPVLLQSDVPATPAAHQPVIDRLTTLIRRGQRSGEFAKGLPVPWLVTATIALGHAAGAEVGVGRMSNRQAVVALRTSLSRLLGVDDVESG